MNGYAVNAFRRRIAGGPQVIATSRLGSVCYVIRGEQGNVLVDAGHPRNAQETVQALDEQGLLAGLRAAIVTHSHADHAGALALLQQRGVEVWAGPRTFSAILRDQERRLQLAPAPYRVDRELRDSEQIDVGGETLRIVTTPGHADDHIAVYMENARVLLCGDLFTFEDIGTCDITRTHADSLGLMEQSILRCAALEPACVGPGHGAPVLDGARLMRTAAKRIRLFRERPAMLIAHTLMPLVVFLVESRNGATIEAIREEVLCHAPLFEQFVAGHLNLALEFDKLLTVLAMRGAVQIDEGRVFVASSALSTAA
jgi:hydroxyacylglutathione hydrolase